MPEVRGDYVRFHKAAAFAVAAIAMFAAVPAHAATPSGPAASADAYGLLVDVQLLPTKTPVRNGPVSRASQDYPVGAAQPAEASFLKVGPLPADGALVEKAGVMTSIAGANAGPLGVASAEVVGVELLGAGTAAPMITADLVRAQANTDCVNNPNATGTTFVNLKINGTPIEYTPAPNTVIDLTVAKVILNEQRPAFDGRGIVVNAIHVISTSTGDALFRGDIIVSHAMSTVSCPNGAGTTGSSNVLKMVKNATPSVATPGTEVTYQAKVTNTSSQACIVNQFIEHLAPAFDFVSTTGDFGTALDRTVARTSGGSDLILGNGKTIPANGTFNQTFVVRVKEGATPGVYYNNLEILCANIGNWVKGLDAPVQVTDQVGPPPKKPQCSDLKDNDGDGQIDYPKDPGCLSPNDDNEVNRDDELPRTGAPGSLYLFAGAGLLLMSAATRKLRKSL
jgi:hypothetical protein